MNRYEAAAAANEALRPQGYRQPRSIAPNPPTRGSDRLARAFRNAPPRTEREGIARALTLAAEARRRMAYDPETGREQHRIQAAVRRHCFAAIAHLGIVDLPA